MIEEVKQIFDDIRKAIIEMGGDIDICTSPEDYDEAIKTLTGNNAVLCVPVFKSSNTKPSRPTTPLKVSNPGPDYPDGWSIPDGLTGNIWMSYTIVSASTTYVPWTEPILIKTVNDIAPETYDDATTRTFLIFLELADLDLEPKAPTGGTWNVVTNRLEGTITSDLYKDEAYTGMTTSDWSSDNKHRKGSYTWMSVGTFIAETGQIMKSDSDPSGWSDPICINGVRDGIDGEDGINGVDGESVEFIYKLFADEDAAQSAIAEGPPESDPNEDDYVPGPNPNTKGYWCDHPMGIDPTTYRAEVMCSRKKNKDGEWGPFRGPTLWSIWGEDGTDGDGIEYIFRVASDREVIDNGDDSYSLKPEFWPPTCAGTAEDGCASGYISVIRSQVSTPLTDEELFEIYQHSEFVPGDGASDLSWDRNWTDEPLDVSTSQPFEFCSIRKYDGDFANTNGKKGKWSWFSTPVLWNKFWSGYAPVFTSFAFTRSRLKLGNVTLEGGDVSNPLPDPKNVTQTVDDVQVTEHVVWFDTIPNQKDFDDYYTEHQTDYADAGLSQDLTIGHAPVWMTTRQFGSIDPDAKEQDQKWDSPRLMADNRYYNIEYSASDNITLSTKLPRFDETPVGSSETLPFIDDSDPEGVKESAWRTYCQTHSLGVWGDEDSILHPKWMATCSFIDGKWTDWTLTQVKGERGADGTGTETVYIRTNSNVAPVVSSTTADSHGKTYLDDDYLPKASGGDLSGATECTDDKVGVDADHKFEWEAKRKKITDPNDPEGKTKIWERYTGAMHLCGNWAEDGQQGPQGPQGPQGIQGKDGDRGSNGSKMRMRNWSTAYTNPDSDGQIGWLTGNDQNGRDGSSTVADPFYDIAIYPVTGEKITHQNAAQNAPRLWLCKKHLPYSTVATLVHSEGAANVYPGSTALQEYFVEAQGWDFVATNVLLAHKISADDIEAGNISAKQVQTVGEDGSINILGNTMQLLTPGGAITCEISGNDLEEIATYSGNDGSTQIVWRQPFGSSQAQNVDMMGFTGDVIIGGFTIDTLSSGESYSLTFERGPGNGLAIQLYLFTNGTSTSMPWQLTGELITGLYIKDANTGKTVASDLRGGNHTQNILLSEQDAHGYGADETVLYSDDDCHYVYVNDNLLENINLPKGNYILCLHYDFITYPSNYPSGSSPSRAYILQTSTSPLTLQKLSGGSAVVAEDAQKTVIGLNGFQHILDTNNYFRVITQVDSNNNKTLMMEFLTNGTQGIQITKDGIKYRNGNNWENLTTP